MRTADAPADSEGLSGSRSWPHNCRMQPQAHHGSLPVAQAHSEAPPHLCLDSSRGVCQYSKVLNMSLAVSGPVSGYLLLRQPTDIREL